MAQPKKRGRGRPATGVDPAVAVRLPPDVLAAVDEVAKSQQVKSRSEAMRRLVERGLAALTPRGTKGTSA
jgi:metal-responsive CopG/Arc/MetJ family transcriptional regulator